MASNVNLYTDPGSVNLMYGYNQVVLENLDSGADKFVLQVYIGGTKVADIRQTPNAIGKAVFDIQKIIQSYTSTTPAYTADFYPNAAETVYYELKYGSETNGVADLVTGTSDFFVALPGRKNDPSYLDQAWDRDWETPLVSEPYLSS